MTEIERILYLNDIFNAVGGACGLIAVMLILGLSRFNRALLERFSIRFTLAISLVDFAKAVAISGSGKFPEDPIMCTAVSFSVNWLLLLYLLLNVAIAANLHMVFLKGRVCTPIRERACWILCFAGSTLVQAIPLVLGKLGKEHATSTCGFSANTPGEVYLWTWACSLFWILSCCSYCTVIVCSTISCLQKKSSVLDRIIVCDSSSQAAEKAQTLKKEIRKLIYRVALYCIIPAATHLGYMILQIHMYHTQAINIPLAYFSIISSDLPGVFNLLALLIDPAFTNVLKSVRHSHLCFKPSSTDSSSSAYPLCDPEVTPSPQDLNPFHKINVEPPASKNFLSRKISYSLFVRGL